MKTIKSLKDITTLEVGDEIVFGNLKYEVYHENGYFLKSLSHLKNDKIFTNLNISKRDFVKNLGIETFPVDWDFPETKSLEALTAIVSALFREYEKQNELPKTWEEFCERNPTENDYYISNHSCIICVKGSRNPNADKNLCTSRQEAEAHLALMQLRQLRKAYVGNWKPDWTCYSTKFCIIVDVNTIRVTDHYFISRSLSFPTEKLANKFLTNFKDLLEVAKPLL